jgi:PAS domain S-box-containing protein
METGRIAAIHQLQILDSPPEEDFDGIVTLAAQLCEAPVAILAFEDTDRFWFKAKVGTDLIQVPHNDPFFAAHRSADGTIAVPDAAAHQAFAAHPLVNGPGALRFFTAVPLITEDNITVGYLCVMDGRLRHLSMAQLSGLRMLARQAISLLQMRLQISQLRKHEEEWKGSDSQMSSIFHNSIAGVVVVDEHDTILQWNPLAESIFGWAADEMIGRQFTEIVIAPRFYDLYKQRLSSHLGETNAPLPNNTIEIKALSKHGGEFDVAIGISPATINGKQFFVNFISDITDRIEATRKLDEQKAFYENILNVLPADIAVFDASHKYLFVNPRGIKDPELRRYIVGKDDFEYAEYRNRDKSVAQVRRDQFMEVKRSGEEIRWEDTVKSPDGTPNTSLRRLFPVFDEHGALKLVIGFGVDITDRKIMEEKQAAMLNQLSVQNTQLIDFCNIVSHNLRAPLVNMSMLVDFIEESEDKEEQMMLISKLRPVIENLHTTFNELVESIQIRQDLEIHSENVDLAECLNRTMEGLRMEINKSEAVIDHDFSEAASIYFPSKYMFSIFHNLVSNALKYQSPQRKPEIKLYTTRKDDHVILSVSDNGLGIDMTKHKDNMFKIGKVFHYHPNSKGFGLFMTKTQVEAMGGTIWVESIPDQGATFFIDFKNQLI